METLEPFILKVMAGLLIAGVIGVFPFIVTLPSVLKDLTKAIDKLEKMIEQKTARIDLLERRLDVGDQIFSDLAEKGISTRLIAEGNQDLPVFGFKRRGVKGNHES